jgi:hypothetical protein
MVDPKDAESQLKMTEAIINSTTRGERKTGRIECFTAQAHRTRVRDRSAGCQPFDQAVP